MQAELIKLIKEAGPGLRPVKMTERGQLTVPASQREKTGADSGGYYYPLMTEEGYMFVPRERVLRALFAELGRRMRESGLTVDDLMESGREIRGELLEEMYGISPGEE